MTFKSPEFHLARVFEDGSRDEAQVVPVTALPWDTRMNRRGALGVGITAGALMLLLPGSSAGKAKGRQAAVDPRQAPAAKGKAHAAKITALAFSPGGEILASASLDNTVKLWEGGRFKATLMGHQADVNALVFAGGVLASGSNDATVRLWSLPDGMPGPLLDGHGGPVMALAAAGDQLFSASQDTIRCWSVPEGKLVGTIEAGQAVESLVVSPDLKVLASGARARSIQLWSLPEGRLLATLTDLPGSSQVLAFSPDGATLVCGDYDGKIRRLAVGDGQVVTTIEAYKGPLRALVVVSDGSLLAAGGQGYERDIKSWSATGATPSATLTPVESATALALSADGRHLASGDDQGHAILWKWAPESFETYLLDPRLGKSVEAKGLKAHSSGINDLCLSPDGARVVTIGQDEMAKVWSIPDGRLLYQVKGEKDFAAGATGGDGSLVALASAKEIGLWSAPPLAPPAPAPPPAKNKKPPRKRGKLPPAAALTLATKLEDPPEDTGRLVLSPEGKTLIASGLDKKIRLWTWPKGEKIGTLEGHGSPIQDFAVSPDGRLLASFSDVYPDPHLRIWSLEEQRLLARIDASGARKLAISPDGGLLVLGSGSGIRLLSLPNGRLVGALAGNERQVTCLELSADGALVAAGSEDRAVYLWSLPEKRLLAALDGHGGAITAITFLPDGRHLASAADDGSLCLWSTEPPGLLASLIGHKGRIVSLAATPDGRFLISGDQWGLAILWDLEKKGIHTYLFDPAANSQDTEGLSFDVYDQVLGRFITYTLPCGSPIPTGAVCTCNCVPGTWSPPWSAPSRSYGGGGGTFCSCNQVCTCVPVPSSRRFKTRIRPLSGALEQVRKLRGVRFEWAADAPAGLAGPDLGLIAEEVAQVLPESVAFDTSGAPAGVHYGRLTALLVEAVKAQQEEIAELQRDLESLRQGMADSPQR